MKQMFLFFAVCVLMLSFFASAQVPQKISYQGLLTTSSGTPVQDGSYNLRFDIYNLQSAGDLRYTETQTGVQVQRGTFSAVLRPYPSIFSESLYVEVTALAGSPGIGSDITFSPRSELTSAPYALAPWTSSGSDIYYNNGNVGIGTSSPATKTDVSGTIRTTGITAPITTGAGLELYYSSDAGSILAFDRSATQPKDLYLGSRNTYFQTKTFGAGTGDVLINSDGNVGIGTTSPNEQLEITGNLRLPVTTATAGIVKVGTSRFIHSYGNNNTFVGLNAGNLTMTGGYNTAFGRNTLSSNTSGFNNTALGDQSLAANNIGWYNTSIGDRALSSNTSGHDNTASGQAALYNNDDGDYNTASGVAALNDNTAGDFNTAHGSYALSTNTTGTNNTAIGGIADVGTNNLTNATAIGAFALVSQSNSLVLGSIAGLNFATNTVRVGIGTNIPQTRLDLGGDLSLRRNPNPAGWNPGAVNNDVNFGDYSFAQVAGGGGTLNGIANGTDGKVIIIYCSAGGMTIANNNAGSLPANQIRTMSNANINIIDEGSVTMLYSTQISKWIVTAFMP